jgi:O-antigen/teichoic acid export membrane protein
MSAGLRERRLRLSVFASLVSKVAGALAQLAVLPVALAGLGDIRFGAFAAITALGQWVSLMGLGVMPSLTRELAQARGGGNFPLERRLVGAGFWTSATLALVALLGGAVIVFGTDPERLLGINAAVDIREVQYAMAASMVITAVAFLGGLSSALRAGYQEYHVTGALTAVGNLIVLLAMIGLSQQPEPILAFVLAVQLPIAALLLGDLAWILVKRRYLLPLLLPSLEALRFGELKGLLTTSGTAWAVQLNNFLVNHASVVLVSLWFGATATAEFGAAMRGVLLANSILGLIVFPMVPAMADAWARGDRDWARTYGRRLVLTSFALAAVGGTAFAVAGNEIMRLWLGNSLSWSRATCVGFGVFFFAFSLNFVNFNMLLALGQTRYVGRLFLAEALGAFVLAVLMRPALGSGAVPVALGGAAICITLGPLSWRLYQLLAPNTGSPVEVASR